MPFLKLFSREWLQGSLRVENDAAERGVWTDFLAMANESRNRGVIQANDKTPYPHPYLASLLNIPLELLEHCIDKFSKQERIIEDKTGITLINFSYYQGIDTRKRGRPRKYPDPTEGQKLDSEYHNRLAVAKMEKKIELGRSLSIEETQELTAKVRREVYGDDGND